MQLVIQQGSKVIFWLLAAELLYLYPVIKSDLMKLLYTLLAIGMVQTATAQDFCKLVKKEVSENKVQIEYTSPAKHDETPAIRVKRSISTDAEYPYDNFVAMFHAVCPLDAIYNKVADGGQTEKQEKSLTIIFEDNSKIVDDTVDISHDFTDDRTEATRYVFYTLTPSQIEDITTKKISKFIIAGQERPFPADSANAVMQYAKCMKAGK